MKYIKSCLNYTGGKYRLLKQILPFFPDNINTFLDIFCGGANVALNVNANSIICNDINAPLIQLFNYIKDNDYDIIFQEIKDIIQQYSLSESDLHGYDYYGCDSSKGLGKYNKANYTTLRDDFNSGNIHNWNKCSYFYTLIVFGFNNQIRFNKQGNFNNPVGKRDFNSRVQKNLKDFNDTIKEKDIEFVTRDFKDFNPENFNSKDFIYLDPPYLITTASYNEQNSWTVDDEKDLLHYLDCLNDNNINFALSNVLESKGKENKLLKEWSQNYNINYLNFNYNNSNYQTSKGKSIEVLITNY